MNRKIIISSVLGASCLGAGAMTFNAFASTPSSPAVVAQQVTTPDVVVDTAAPDDAEQGSGRLSEVLAPLVSDATITQSQADAVIEALKAARPEGGRGGGHHGGPGRGHDRPGLEAAATALEMTEDEVSTALRDGSTLAELAATQNVPVQTVIDALVGEAKTRIDARVADGDLTQAEADVRLAELTTKITDVVNNGRPQGDRRGHGPDAEADEAGD
jgi:hypothetical protein